MSKKMIMVVIMLVSCMVVLAGCSKNQVADAIDKDVEYIAVDRDGELVVRPVEINEITVKEIEIMTVEEYEKKTKKKTDEDAVKTALLNGTADLGGCTVTFEDGFLKEIK